MDWLRCEEVMKTTGRENQKRYSNHVACRASRNGRRAQTCSMGRAGRKKNSGRRRSVFFLDSLYGTNQEL